ncbi:hypothetical protein E1B28_001177 [Marasmius oreades]|uniref:RecA family profile 1 domain-containing protein n=1 Tax=Marasmius oreades TaxID=181124 RepID=A0A9P7V2Z5_9AGAR|nr:uncharacterized protein E1B28_001177 [Marasmius oreades]KAG7099319.1 hypothetical protein E1B28_001177 [Marasmius oreades]
MLLEEIHHESLQQLLNGIRSQSELVLVPGLPLTPGNVLEVQGASGSGKTHLLYAAIIICISPATGGGWGKGAVLFDSDNSFDLNRFKSLFTSHVAHSLHSTPFSQTLQTLVDRCLNSLHIFRPSSSDQLASSILHLPLYHSSQMMRQEIGLIAIDSLSAFYWPDRYAIEQLRSRAGYNTVKDASNPLRHILIALERIRVMYRPLIIFTNWGLTFSQPELQHSMSHFKFYKQHLHPLTSLSADDGHLPVPHGSMLLPLSHHITLTSTPAIQSHLKPDHRADTEDEETLGSARTKQKCMVIGAVRIPGVPEVVKFSFAIETDSLSFCKATDDMSP